jgi:hypothetical protein
MVGISAAEMASDHNSLDLVRALADLENLGVAVEPRNGVFVHVPVPAVDLDGFGRGAHGELGRK